MYNKKVCTAAAVLVWFGWHWVNSDQSQSQAHCQCFSDILVKSVPI